MGKRIRQLNGGKKEHWPDILTEQEEYEMRVLEQEQSCIHRGRALNRIQVCGCLLTLLLSFWSASLIQQIVSESQNTKQNPLPFNTSNDTVATLSRPNIAHLYQDHFLS